LSHDRGANDKGATGSITRTELGYRAEGNCKKGDWRGLFKFQHSQYRRVKEGNREIKKEVDNRSKKNLRKGGSEAPPNVQKIRSRRLLPRAYKTDES